MQSRQPVGILISISLLQQLVNETSRSWPALILVASRISKVGTLHSLSFRTTVKRRAVATCTIMLHSASTLLVCQLRSGLSNSAVQRSEKLLFRPDLGPKSTSLEAQMEHKDPVPGLPQWFLRATTAELIMQGMHHGSSHRPRPADSKLCKISRFSAVFNPLLLQQIDCETHPSSTA